MGLTKKGRSKKAKKPLDEQSEARVQQFKAELKKLGSTKGDDVRGSCVLDLSARFIKIADQCRLLGSLMDIPLATKVHAAILKHATKPTVGRGATIKLDGKSVQMAINIFCDLLERLNRRSSNPTRQLDQLSRRLTSTSVQMCASSDSQTVWFAVLDLARQAARSGMVRFEDYLSEEQLGPNFRVLMDRTVESLEKFVECGDVQSANRTLISSRGHDPLEETIKTLLESKLLGRISLLPRASQEWLLKQTGQTIPAVDFEYTNPADSPQIKQAASLLLLVFDLRRDDVTNEVYERFKVLCEQHFKLFLRGNVGETVPYDGRLHEVASGRSTSVRLLRPWVEWYNPPDARVVVRALAEAADTA